MGADYLRNSSLRYHVDALKGIYGESAAFRFCSSAQGREVGDEFEDLFAEATTRFNAECHESVSLGFDFVLPFYVFEISAVIIRCTRDFSSFPTAPRVAWIRCANVSYDQLLV